MADTYNHTFVGFVGAEQPEAVILVRIHDTRPTSSATGARPLEMSSNELFRRVAVDTIDALEIPPLTDDTPAPDGTPSPDATTPSDALPVDRPRCRTRQTSSSATSLPTDVARGDVGRATHGTIGRIG